MKHAAVAPAPEAIRRQLAKIVASERFRAAPSLTRFLSFIVEETIAGRADALKEYLIGVDVFGRGEEFDPRIDPIVRVQARKLRKRLEEFYDLEGVADMVVIDLQKGGYAPLFRERKTVEPAPVDSPPTPSQSSKRSAVTMTRRRLVIVAAALILLLTATWRFFPWTARPTSPRVSLTRLTFDSGQTTHGAVSPDGRLLAFSSDRGPQGDSNIWIQPLSGGEALQLTHHAAADTSPDFSPDGSRIVFRSWRDGGGIYVVPVFGGQERRVAPGGYSPRFSPDGKWIAYAQGGIRVVPTAGGEPRRVSGSVGGTACPLWTADGHSLVFVGEAPEGYDWWVASFVQDHRPALTGVAAQLRKSGLKDFDETACPSDWIGNDVVFTLKVDGMGNLWRIPLKAKTWTVNGLARQVVPGPGVDHARAIPSTGESIRLVFATDTNLSHLWSLPAETNRGQTLGEITQLTRDASLVGGLEGTRPLLSVNGDRLIFPSSRSGNMDIWLKDMNTGKEEGLSSDHRREDRPVTNVSGETVAYQVSEGARRSIYITNVNQRLPRRICEDCAHPMDLSPDGALVLHRRGEPAALHLTDVRIPSSVELLKDPANVPREASFSPDMHWIALVTSAQGGDRQVGYVVRFDGRKLPDSKTWIPITDELYHLQLRWSPDGNLLYYFATRDDHRCLWATRLDPATKHSVGEPLSIRHFHTVQRYPLSGSWVSVARDRLAFNLTDVTSNIWMAAIQ